jgi:hypothetical protein
MGPLSQMGNHARARGSSKAPDLSSRKIPKENVGTNVNIS